MKKSKVKSLVLSELLSPAKATKELQSKHKNTTIAAMEAVELVQDFLGKESIAAIVVDNFKSGTENDFVKFIASQLPTLKRKDNETEAAYKERVNTRINGANLFPFMVQVSKRSTLK